MYDDDRDALAAEYVLGTLSTDERDQAEALLAIDPGFAEIVRVWERRLGELNVMVEAVEPPAELWDRIRSEVGGPASTPEAETLAPVVHDTAPLIAPDMPAEAVAAPVEEPQPQYELTPDLLSETPLDPDAAPVPEDLDAAIAAPRDLDDEATINALASSLLSPEEPPAGDAPPLEPTAFVAPAENRGADIIKLQDGVRRWRVFTAAMTVIAAMLAVFVAVSQLAPELLPDWRHAHTGVIAAKPPASGDRFVAALQQEPTAPAFLLTVNPQSRTLTVRRVSAAPESGRSYELWLVAGKTQSPRSLGLVGGDEFTTRPIPTNFDVDAMRDATYAVSLEPAGGSPSGAPSGPILFTGRMVESLPGSPS
jgi:anti-sigma-K factor RskA